jgi:hypothetical protein
MLAVTKPRRAEAPPQSEFEAALERWTKYANERRELQERLAAIKLARSLALNLAGVDRISPAAKAAAQPYLRDAEKRPDRLATTEADTREKLEALEKNLDDESQAIAAARRIASLLNCSPVTAKRATQSAARWKRSRSR